MRRPKLVELQEDLRNSSNKLPNSTCHKIAETMLGAYLQASDAELMATQKARSCESEELHVRTSLKELEERAAEVEESKNDFRSKLQDLEADLEDARRQREDEQRRAGDREAINTPFCRSQGRFHAVVLRGVRHDSEAP